MPLDTHRLICIECEAATEKVYRLRESEWAHSPYGIRAEQGIREHCGVCPGCQASSEAEQTDGVSEIGVPLERPQALSETSDESSDADVAEADTNPDDDYDSFYRSPEDVAKTLAEEMPRYFPHS